MAFLLFDFRNILFEKRKVILQSPATFALSKRMNNNSLKNDNKMKKIVLVLLTSLAFGACAKSQSITETMTEQTEKQTQQEVANTIRTLTLLMIERNINELETLLDNNFTLTHITGYVQPKTEWLEEIRTESMKYYGYEEVQMSVKTDGNKATVTNRNLLDARIWGNRNKWRLQQVVTLEKRGNKWIILKSVASTF